MGMNSEISTVTISIYELIEQKFDFQLDKYTIFDENYRTTLNEAILNYYMFREIGIANPAVWRQRFTSRLDLIMRNKYNAMYTAKAKEFNPLYTMELYEDYTHSVTNVGTNSNNGEVNYNTNSTSNTSLTGHSTVNTTDDNHVDSENLSLSSNFPSEEMTEGDLTDNVFVDGATKVKGSEDTSGTSEQTNDNTGSNNTVNTGVDKTTNVNNGTTSNTTTETFHKKTEGSASDLSFAHAMMQFKDYCDGFRLDEQVIHELRDLFLTCY